MNKKLIIAVQGDRGSFSEQAAALYSAKQQYTNASYHYAITSQGVLEALQEKMATMGIVALYNSLGGLVKETQIMLQQANPQILDALYLDVEQNLIVVPGTNLNQIKKIQSHPQALKQCSKYLAKNFPDAEIVETADTALAARHLAISQERTTAVIGCITAAEAYKLALLDKNIQDAKVNQTIFIVIM